MLVIKNTIQRRIILKIKLKLPDHGLQSDEEQEELKVEPETRRNIPGNEKCHKAECTAKCARFWTHIRWFLNEWEVVFI